MMCSNSYENLRRLLDTFPTSFPKTEEGIEIALLKKFFSEEEAEIACIREGNLYLSYKTTDIVSGGVWG